MRGSGANENESELLSASRFFTFHCELCPVCLCAEAKNKKVDSSKLPEIYIF